MYILSDFVHTFNFIRMLLFLSVLCTSEPSDAASFGNLVSADATTRPLDMKGVLTKISSLSPSAVFV